MVSFKYIIKGLQSINDNDGADILIKLENIVNKLEHIEITEVPTYNRNRCESDWSLLALEVSDIEKRAMSYAKNGISLKRAIKILMANNKTLRYKFITRLTNIIAYICYDVKPLYDTSDDVEMVINLNELNHKQYKQCMSKEV